MMNDDAVVAYCCCGDDSNSTDKITVRQLCVTAAAAAVVNKVRASDKALETFQFQQFSGSVQRSLCSSNGCQTYYSRDAHVTGHVKGGY
jgi:hypothetical protein